ncbi:hypothetical protein ACPOL_6756 (plasmid) [Acidisarcina polymorpha]|uniref:Uncharacterized protein n=1 Tax=Acidisarcina polymorpha TaxID=2211140 RepID=A0A2Z5GBE4_9BACT|nr:hypothetical protein ACPOL_6756 [Acidisarcina polymorpha]
MKVARYGLKILLAIPERQDDKINMARHLRVKGGAVAAAVDNPPAVSVGVDRAKDFCKVVRVTPVENTVRPAFLF